MKQYWEWTATDKFGRSRDYQCNGYDVCEATMLAFLRSAFIGMTFTNIKRIREGECKVRTGKIESHTFQFGIMDAVMRGEPLNGIDPSIIKQTTPIRRDSILQRRRSILAPK